MFLASCVVLNFFINQPELFIKSISEPKLIAIVLSAQYIDFGVPLIEYKLSLLDEISTKCASLPENNVLEFCDIFI